VKAILHYLFLVGIPVLGVFGLLQMGKGITPPVSVGGTWLLEITPPFTGEDTCGHFLSWSDKPRLMISQSGPHLLFTFNDKERTQLAGKVEGQTLSISTAKLNLKAALDRQVKPDRLRGEITLNHCSTPLMLTATREMTLKERSRNH